MHYAFDSICDFQMFTCRCLECAVFNFRFSCLSAELVLSFGMFGQFAFVLIFMVVLFDVQWFGRFVFRLRHVQLHNTKRHNNSVADISPVSIVQKQLTSCDVACSGNQWRLYLGPR